MDVVQATIALGALGLLAAWLLLSRRKSQGKLPPILQEGYSRWTGHLWYIVTAHNVAQDQVVANIVRLVQNCPLPVTRLYLGPKWWTKAQFFVRDPQLIAQVLAKGSRDQQFQQAAEAVGGRKILPALVGNEWKRHKKLLTSSILVRKAVARFVDIMAAYGGKYLDGLPETVELDLIKSNCTTTLVGDTLSQFAFSKDLSKSSGEPPELLQKLESSIHSMHEALFDEFNTFGIKRLLVRLSPAKRNRLRAARAFLRDAVISPAIRQRRREIADGVDVPSDALSMMLQKTDDDDDLFSEEEMFDELQMILTAGYETTGTTLLWLFFHLAQHPEEQDICHKEVTQVMSKLQPGALPTAENLDEFTHVKNVLYESQRLQPVFPMLRRWTTEEMKLGEYTIPAGNTVTCVPVVNALSEEMFDNARDFRPSRWADDATGGAKKPGMSSSPWGHGQYRCFGQSLAQYSMRALVAVWLQRYRFELVSSKDVESFWNLTQTPRDLRIRMHRR